MVSSSWHLFWISAPPELRDAIAGFLPGLGSSGLLEQDGNLGAYFPPGGLSRKELMMLLYGMLERLRSCGVDTHGVSIGYEPVDDRDWNEAWKKGIQPVRLDCDIVIVPPWLDDTATGRLLKLVIEPASAFGTGHHETTTDCLCAIRHYAAEAQRASRRFTDLGTGTGLLAILAAHLGFEPVVAIDNDPEAVSAALRNSELNGVTDAVQVRRGSIQAVPAGCGMIAANLFAGLLTDYMPNMSQALSRGGLIVVSGMLEGQEERVEEAMAASGIRLRERICRERWVTLTGVKA